MWNLHNSQQWINGFKGTPSNVTNSRYAHPDHLPASSLPDPLQVKRNWPVNGDILTKFSKCGSGCVASLDDDRKTLRHALRWAVCVIIGGEQKRWGNLSTSLHVKSQHN